MTVKEFFDFITDVTINEENMEQYLDKISEKLVSPVPLTDDQIIDEEVFKNAYIPRTLNEVVITRVWRNFLLLKYFYEVIFS